MRGILIGKNISSRNVRLDFNPTLESILMVERTIEKYSGEYTPFLLWKKLPRKTTYQAYKIILSYLLESNKITLDKKKMIVWIWDPEGIENLRKRGLII